MIFRMLIYSRETKKENLKMDEKDLKRIIESRYNSVRAFAIENDIPYTTMRSILERGVMNAKAETIFKICDALGINPESFAEEKSDWQSTIDLSNLRERVVMFDGKPLSDDDVKKIEAIIKLSLGVGNGEDK